MCIIDLLPVHSFLILSTIENIEGGNVKIGFGEKTTKKVRFPSKIRKVARWNGQGMFSGKRRKIMDEAN